MVDFALFRLLDDFGDFDAFVDFEGDRTIHAAGPIERPDFTAKLYFTDTMRERPPWLSFIEEGFGSAMAWQPSRTISAVVIVNANPEGPAQFFALAFGMSGRHMIRGDVYRRRYGLTSALNLIGDAETPPQLREFGTTRHARSILRSRLQTAALSPVDVFELDVLRDLVRSATGQPADTERWGTRVGGSDAFRLARDIGFDELGAFCRAIDEAANVGTYRDRFDWIDNIRPISDRQDIEALEGEVIALLLDNRTDVLQLAPPEMVDWDRLSGFQYHYDTRRGLVRSDLVLRAYIAGLREKDPGLEEVTPDWLRRRQVIGVDEDRDRCGSWSVWRCLVGEFEYNDRSYVLEDGSFYQVAESYLQQLNHELIGFSREADILPAAKPGMTEPDYNREVARGSDHLLLLDARTVRPEGSGSGIEVCDLLTDTRQFIHVKRYKGSQGLSYLASQARVSAEQLLVSGEFRTRARELIAEQSDGDPVFDVIDAAAMRTDEFEVVLAIIKAWGDDDVDALPFFAKVELRRTITDLRSRGYLVGVERVPIAAA